MSTVKIKDKEFVPFLSYDLIIKEVERVAQEMTRDYAGKKPLLLVMLNGAFVYAADLVRLLHFPCDISFVKWSSYSGTASTGQHKELLGLAEPVEGRHVVVVEDIVDSGLTMQGILQRLSGMNPASVAVSALLLKPDALRVPLTVDYVALHIPNDFIVGYGLDYDGLGRNLRDIYVLKKE